MEFTFENQGVSSFVVYTMKPEDQIDTMNFGMMTNNNIPNVLSMIFTQTDQDRYIKFNVSSKTSLKMFLQGVVNKKRLLTVFAGICNAYASAEDYMLSANAFVLDPEYIFVNVSTSQPSLICLPIVCNSEMPDIKKFFKNLIFNVRSDPNENNDHIGKMLGYMNSPEIFSIEKFQVIVNSLLAGGTGNVSTNSQPSVSQPVQQYVQPPVSQQAQQYVQPPVSQPTQQYVQQPVSQPVKQPLQQPVQQPIQQPVQQVYKQPLTQQSPAAPKPQVKVGDKQSLQQPQIPKKKVSPIAPTENAPVEPKKKKGFFGGLFRGKDKSSKQSNNVPSITNPGSSKFSIPGQKSEPVMINNSGAQNGPQRVVPQAPQPVPQFNQNVNQAPAPSPYPSTPSIPVEEKRQVQMQSIGGFGETMNFEEGDSAGETTVLSPQSFSRQPYLIRRKNGEKIIINKDVFKIGKERSYNDYFIGDNPAISRNHATILKNNDQYFVNDGSTNGTYINGQRIERGQNTPLTSGVRITFGNEDFEFYTY